MKAKNPTPPLTITLQVRLDSDMAKLIALACEQRGGISNAALLRLALADYLRDVK